jgi:trehalose 6-phosphate phosphatase
MLLYYYYYYLWGDEGKLTPSSRFHRSKIRSQHFINNTKGKEEETITSSSYIIMTTTQCIQTLDGAIDHFDELRQQANNKEIIVFLDYDGTLAPIVARPEMAYMSEEAREAVEKVAEKYTTAIISGRAKWNVKKFVQLDNLYYAGSHGFDIDGPQGINYQIATDYIPVLKQACEQIEKQVCDINGVIVENNLFSLSIHYRLVSDTNDVQRVHDIVEQIVDSNETYQNMLRITHGKKVIEVRAKYDWHKGKAVLHLLDRMEMQDPNKVFAIYIGDDKTDEDAFRALKESKLGVGIVVASKEEPHTDMTSAKYYLPKCSQVIDFLQMLATKQ